MAVDPSVVADQKEVGPFVVAAVVAVVAADQTQTHFVMAADQMVEDPSVVAGQKEVGPSVVVAAVVVAVAAADQIQTHFEMAAG